MYIMYENYLSLNDAITMQLSVQYCFCNIFILETYLFLPVVL